MQFSAGWAPTSYVMDEYHVRYEADLKCGVEVSRVGMLEYGSTVLATVRVYTTKPTIYKEPTLKATSTKQIQHKSQLIVVF